MSGFLYVITNKINGKQYVGKTYTPVEVRFKRHLQEYKYQTDRPICRAISKYGPDSFCVETVGEYEEGELELEEQNLIEKLNTYNKGYNATLGGDGSRLPRSYSHSELIEFYTTSKSIRDTARHFKCSEAIVSNDLGSLRITGTTRPDARKCVTIVELDQTYESAADCARALIEADVSQNTNVNSVASNILRVIRGDAKSYLGFTYI